VKWTIIASSDCDFRDEEFTKENIVFKTVPLVLTFGEDDYIDNLDLDTAGFIPKMRAAKTLRTACPSPEAFADLMRGEENIIVVTITSKLSGTHQSAKLAIEQIKSETPEKNVYLLDSLSASAGVGSMCLAIINLIKDNPNISFDELTARLPAIQKRTKVRFLLQDLSNLVKTGRMSRVAGAIVGLTPLKLVCGDNGEGEIKKFGAALGTRKGLAKLAELFQKERSMTADNNPVVIAHAHNETDAGYLATLLEKLGTTNIKTVLMRGVSTFYANDKGIVLAY